MLWAVLWCVQKGNSITYAGEEQSSQSTIHNVKNPVTDEDAEDAEDDQDN